MLRLTELKLPLGHAPEAIKPAIIERLGVTPDDLIDFAVVRRAHDARIGGLLDRADLNNLALGC